MGTQVLDAPSSTPDLYLYAHCLRGSKGGVALLAINASQKEARALSLPKTSSRYTLSAADPMASSVSLNGVELALTPSGDFPSLDGAKTAAGPITLQPESITFFALPGAKNSACR